MAVRLDSGTASTSRASDSFGRARHSLKPREPADVIDQLLEDALLIVDLLVGIRAALEDALIEAGLTNADVRALAEKAKYEH